MYRNIGDPYFWGSTARRRWQNRLLLARVRSVVALTDETGRRMTERYRVDPGEPSPGQRYRQQKRILRVRWPGHVGDRVWEFTAEAHYQREFYAGSIPPFQAGVGLEVEEDDGSAAFARAHEAIAARGL